ncbi:hypothetical protein GCM10023214_53510 [Amycolatopsis dongchuanensis]|uniref:Uncharacterized protein n=1 Tax=Amycolatopsis dongchuanensis TaxID=1070866 RepID=A0ABP9R715_9PSEU
MFVHGRLAGRLAAMAAEQAEVAQLRQVSAGEAPGSGLGQLGAEGVFGTGCGAAGADREGVQLGHLFSFPGRWFEHAGSGGGVGNRIGFCGWGRGLWRTSLWCPWAVENWEGCG